MAETGSYTWWRANHADNQHFKAVYGVPAMDLARNSGLIDATQYFDLRLNHLAVPL